MNGPYPIAPAGPPGAPTDQGPPAVLGNYRLLDLLGRGGMGEVYRAECDGPGGIRRRAAVKRILPRFQQDPTLRARFLAEARITARLEHPNIVRVLDCSDQPEPWMALEFVEGTSVARVLKQCAETRRRVPPALAAYIIAEAATGLDYAHRRCDDNNQPLQIIHRDVSPQNVLISTEGAVKISDFGIARAADNQLRTAAGVAVGKLAYMAPEQVAGRTIDWRVDVFALGVLLWETLLVRPLIPRGDTNAAVQLLMSGRFEPPSRVDPSLPPALDAIVLGALAVDPNQRTQSAGLLAQQLRAVVHQIHPGFDGAELARTLSSLLPEVAWQVGPRPAAAPEAAPAPAPPQHPPANGAPPMSFGVVAPGRVQTLPPPTASGPLGIHPVGAVAPAPAYGAQPAAAPAYGAPVGPPGAPPGLAGGPLPMPPTPAPAAPAGGLDPLLVGLPPSPPRARYDLPPPPSTIESLPILTAPEPERDPKKTARLITAGIVVAMLALAGLGYYLVTRSNDDPVARRAGGPSVAVSARVETPPPPPVQAPAQPAAPTPPRPVRDYTAAALAALTARSPAVDQCLRQRAFRSLADEATTAASFDNANGTVREVTVRYRNTRRGANPEALTRCLTAAVQPARFTPSPPEPGFTQVSKDWPMGRALPRSGRGPGGGMFFPFSTPH